MTKQSTNCIQQATSLRADTFRRGAERIDALELEHPVHDIISQRVVLPLSDEEAAIPEFASGEYDDIEYLRTVIFEDGTRVDVRDLNIFDGGHCITLANLPEGQDVRIKDGREVVCTWSSETHESVIVREIYGHEAEAINVVLKLFPEMGLFRM